MYRNVGEYNCLVGISGGKDSTYVIYRLKSHYDAKILTWTWDNGFLTDYAKENINRVVKEFDVDHIWIKPDSTVTGQAYQQSIIADCWPCTACFHFANATPWKIAYEKKIPFIIHGRTPEQILRKPDASTFESPYSLIADNLAPYDKDRVIEISKNHMRKINKIKEWLLHNESVRELGLKNVYLSPDFAFSKDFAVEELAFFLYEIHDEPYMMDVLSEKTNWVRPEDTSLFGHADCSAHEAAGYMYQKMNKSLLLDYEISAAIRHNKLDRQKGLEIINKAAKDASVFPEESMNILSEASSISKKSLKNMHRRIKYKSVIKSVLGK
ncbi:MAG: hypothetical protein GY865_13370 [candidate division Zixibacteria bacterium]|nr:hypothetical protein [candidate division Zixibacteria bacterium]